MNHVHAGQLDRFGLAHGGGNAAALHAFGEATEAVAGYRPSLMPALDRALAEMPDMAAALALRGLLLVLAARTETLEQARALCRRLPEAATQDERALHAALRAGVAHGLLAAAGELDAHLARRPDLLLLVKLATLLRFVGGDSAGMLRITARALPAWRPALPGYGYVLGCHAFGLEEAGEFAQAERLGREAVAICPQDAWAVHAVAHVHEMTGRADDGIAWIEGLRPDWRGCNNFALHLSWHLALFHLERDEPARVLELYDRDIRPDRSEDTRDYTNAVSLLWRLREHGVDVGARWDELAEIARRRRHEATLLFAALHRLLALRAAGDAAGVAEVVAAIAASEHGEQAGAARQFGARLARVLAGLSRDCAGLAAQLAPLGGSHAQRDVFMRALALLAKQRGDAAALADILGVRRRMKRDDRLLGSLTHDSVR